MNYYLHHIGDYAQATAHLTFVEDAAYSRLIRKYYAEERPLAAEISTVQRLIGARTREEKSAVEAVLKEFFFLDADGWHNKRADSEINQYHEKSSKAAASARARWDKTHTERNANAMRTHSEGNANHTPVTNNQEPVTNNHKPLTTNQQPINHKPTKEPMQRGTRLPADCVLTTDWADFCKQERPDLVAGKVFDEFRDYWIAQPGQKGVKTNWGATWRNWVRNQRSTASYKTATERRQENNDKAWAEFLGEQTDRVIEGVCSHD